MDSVTMGLVHLTVDTPELLGTTKEKNVVSRLGVGVRD